MKEITACPNCWQDDSATGQFRFTLTGEDGRSYPIQASTNLVTWIAVTNCLSATGTNPFTDPAAPNYSRRFYRAVTQSSNHLIWKPEIQFAICRTNPGLLFVVGSAQWESPLAARRCEMEAQDIVSVPVGRTGCDRRSPRAIVERIGL